MFTNYRKAKQIYETQGMRNEVKSTADYSGHGTKGRQVTELVMVA